MDPMQVELPELERYLRGRCKTAVKILEVRQLGGTATGATALKQFGYGHPFRVSYEVGDRTEDIVVHRIRRNAFGRERDDDRVAAVWLDFQTFNHLPYHVPALDMLAHNEDGTLASLESTREILLVTAYRPGTVYAKDLLRIREQGDVQPLDMRRAERLATCLAEVHSVAQEDPALWRRRLRDLIGHGEGIMGLTDSYPTDAEYVGEQELRNIEETANRWRWRLKPRHHRLCRVHGDFHPFNIVFDHDVDVHLLDRSRGEWGEPADDVSCLTINYLFFSLQRSGKLEGAFEELHHAFWERYLSLRPDHELASVIQPWFAWRALVLASPTWYPDLTEDLRRTLLTFARRVMDDTMYDHHRVNRYLGVS
jgi:hypothetical protein